MSDQHHPELHVIEEPRNDLMDVGIGFLVFTGVLFLIAIAATVVTIVAR